MLRQGMELVENRLGKGGSCPNCSKSIPIILDWRKGRKKT
jgi:hypothetical protein